MPDSFGIAQNACSTVSDFLGQIFTPASPSPPCSNMSLGGFGHHNTTVLKWVPGFGDLSPLFKF